MHSEDISHSTENAEYEKDPENEKKKLMALFVNHFRARRFTVPLGEMN